MTLTATTNKVSYSGDGSTTAFTGRFWDKVSPEPNSGCWLWDGSRDTGGYGVLKVNGKGEKAHRVAYEMFKGPIPDGLELDHLCRVRCCVNPDHLEPVTRSENILRGALPGVIARHQRSKTHCPKGHPYAGSNLYLYGPRGYRYCRACNAEKARARRRARSGGGQ